MIGDRENREDDVPEEPAEEYGPLDAMVRLDPPPSPYIPGDPISSLALPPAWVERYDRVVIVRHTFVNAPDGCRESYSERACPSAAVATREMARQIAVLLSRGYQVVTE